jgi:hypothetical protein
MIINPSITQEVVAERVADLRREAAHQRASREVVRRSRRAARHSDSRWLRPVSAQRSSDAQLTDELDALDALDVLELCVTNRD